MRQAAYIEAVTGGSLSSVNCGSLPEDFPTILPYLGGVVSAPEFSEEALNRAKAQVRKHYVALPGILTPYN